MLEMLIVGSVAVAPRLEDITPITCFGRYCYENDWLFYELAPYLTLVAGGLIFKRWTDLPIVALAGIVVVDLGLQIRHLILVGQFAQDGLVSLLPSQGGNFVGWRDVQALSYLYLTYLLVASFAHGLKRGLLAVMRRVGFLPV